MNFTLNFATTKLIVSYAPKWRGCSILGERQLGVFPEGEFEEKDNLLMAVAQGH